MCGKIKCLPNMRDITGIASKNTGDKLHSQCIVTAKSTCGPDQECQVNKLNVTDLVIVESSLQLTSPIPQYKLLF